MLSQQCFPGYLAADRFCDSGQLSLLGLDGKVLALRLTEIKWVCFVRSFPAGAEAPEHLLTRRFARRPRAPGLWIRAVLEDGESIEGLAQNDRSLLDEAGFFLIPPDSRSNTQRIFLPRQAVREMEIVAVIRTAAPKKPLAPIQEDLFNR